MFSIIFRYKENPMKKNIIAVLTTIFLSTFAFASEKIVVLNTNTNNGNAFTQTKAYAEDFEALGYEVEFVSPGNTCQANAFLQKVPADQPVFVNINIFQADALAGKIDNCEGLMVSEQDLVAVYLDHYYLCTVTQKDNPTALFREGAEFRIGHNKPSGYWNPILETINAENNTNNKIIQYGGSGKQKTAMFAGELDYAILTTNHTFKIEAKGAVCFAEFTKRKKLRYDHTVADLSAGDADLDASLANAYALKNATNEQVARLRSEVEELHHSNDSNIIKALGGKPPIQYYGWEIDFAERADWVNEVLNIWTDAVRK